MQKFNNILLFGGETKNENMPTGFYSSLAMLPLRGKPVIWWQLNNLKEQGLDNFIIVVCKDNLKLIDYIDNILSKAFDIKLVAISNKKNILSSLKYGLQVADLDLPTRVILGDTYLSSSINEKTDVLYTSDKVNSSENWCLVECKNSNILYFYDKWKNLKLDNKEALVGYYSFLDTRHLLFCCTTSRLLLKKEISTALIEYQKKYHLSTQHVDDWYDLGHTSGLIKVKNILFNARDFNSISVNTELGTLTKSSTKIQKLEDEWLWFNALPKELQVLSPRCIDFEKNNEIARLTQELYGYSSLQELYLSGEVSIEDWSYILEKLFALNSKFKKYTIKSDKVSLQWLYLDKLIERVDLLKNQNMYWENLLNKEYVNINGKKFKSIKLLIEDIKSFAENLANIDYQTIMHGDYCFSNILFDSLNYSFRLIDPRGRLDKEATIYGDSRYDIAKLRHSVCGFYDFVVQGLFKLDETSEGLNYKILTTSNYTNLIKVFDKLTTINGYDVEEIKFIEATLFLSMIPLHKDNFERQKVLFAKAIELFNSINLKKNKGKKEWKKENLEYVLT